jgi:hypothetical protein
MFIERSCVGFLIGLSLAACDGQGQAARMVDGGASPVWIYGGSVSNVPVTTFTVNKKPEAADLELLSSNLVPALTSASNYVEWFGEVKNNGTTPACFVEVRANFITADGFGVLALSGYADGSAYKIPSLTSTIPCIPPGQTSAIWSNDALPLPPELATIDIIEVKLSLTTEKDAAPAPSAPVFGNVAIAQDPKKGAGFWTLAGTLTARETIHNVSVKGYPKDGNGLVLEHAYAGHSDTLGAGASWTWQTDAYAGERPSAFLVQVDYQEGAKP